MEIKRFLTFLLVGLLLILGASACTRNLAPNNANTAVPGGEEQGATEPAEPGATSDVMEQIWQLATQTALAQQGGQAPAQETPAPGEGEATSETPGEGEETGAPPAEGEATAIPPEEAQPPAESSTDTPAPTLIVVPTATPGLPRTYTLQSGEFPYCIARRFNVNPVELLNASGLSVNSRPGAGTTLTIPQSGNPFPGDRTLRAHPTTHTVQSGENIYEIACYFGDVSPEAIAFANNLTAPYNLQAGQQLQIP